ncbi:T9SS type A sorting domain-containing protein [Aureisphaera galaxeae]|uniref:T9SS type A sorting domain-containing protein n=1 Tax=Aureisphaera galaxeae TaxID=1538023 RepID=UPI002350FD95|nr:T9SS type A sorting domain-containing protein [Aureisphaera galaxeae]MDC8006136.1 T9SS type A sorting domain-containing protein [Aureisphaera galaxeae]
MKKTTISLAVLISTCMFFQGYGQEVNLEDCIQRYEDLSGTALSEHDVLQNYFNSEERELLSHYLEQQRLEAITQSPMHEGQLSHTFYVHDIRSTGNLTFGTLDGEAPFDAINTIIEPLSATCFAGDFDNTGTLYALTTEPDPVNGFPYVKDLVTIDTTDGSVTVIGDMSTYMGQDVPTGLTFDFTTNTMYATTGDVLFEVDYVNGTAAPIGSFDTAGGVVIWLEIDNNGNAFAADIQDDSFYSVDLDTGNATLIGPLGVDISFAQGAAIDPVTNTLYMAGYQGGGVGAIHSIDKVTGVATLIGETTPLDVELAVMSIEGIPDLGVEDNSRFYIKTYPNPVTTELTLEGLAGIAIEEVSVFDVLGRNMGIEMINSKINFSQLPRGIYILKINTSEGVLSQKVVKQ